MLQVIIYIAALPAGWLIGSGILLVLVILFFIPWKGPVKKGSGVPERVVDERDVLFSREKLISGTKRYETYYRRKPAYRALDERFRRLPGLLSPGSDFYHPLAFAAAEAAFRLVSSLGPHVREQPAGKKQDADPGELTRFIKGWMHQAGAHSVGVTTLREEHLYTHHGRNYRYGEPVINRHSHAVVLTVEMDLEMTRSGPLAPVVMESSRQYLTSGSLAIMLATMLRSLGYEALAHIDAHYEVICPLVARDAGLGEIGRMGLLMTPDLGPRVRIAAVTTEAPLIPDPVKEDHSMIDFCKHCKKCARVCPSQSIPWGDREYIHGALRWQISSESCFTYWCKAGTDCGRCMAVCPYAHRNNLLHNLIRRGIRNNVLFRRLAVQLDDVFYGKKPARGKYPGWMPPYTNDKASKT